MERFKFRGWDKTESEWVDIKIIGLDGNDIWYVMTQDEFERDIDPPFFPERDELALMQYTGLKDKHGVEIYEGDIVRFIYGEGPDVSSDGNDVIDAWSKEEVSGVTFSQGSFLIGKHLMWAIDEMDMGYSIEVIGNVYEHSHLLEEERT